MSPPQNVGISLSLELVTMHGAVRGVVNLSTWAYEQTDDEARRSLPDIIALLEIINVRLRDLDRVVRGELAPGAFVAAYNRADAVGGDDLILRTDNVRRSRARKRNGT